MDVNIRETIIKAAAARGWSAYRLGKESGVPIRTVQGYFNRTRDLTGERIDKLAAALGLELRAARQPRRKA